MLPETGSLDSQAILESLPVATMVVDSASGDVLFMNASFRSLFGLAPGELANERDWWPMAFPNPHYREHIAREWGFRIREAKDNLCSMPPLEAVARCADGREYTLRKLFACQQDKYIVTLMDVTDLKLLREDYENIAVTDPLTGLVNRRTLLALLEQTLSLATRHARPLSILLAGIDNFRELLEAHGSHVGEVVISHVASLVRNSLRNSDTASRFNDEKFAMLLPETGSRGAMRIAERLRQVLAENICYYAEQPIHITLSFGVGALPGGEAASVDCKHFLHMAESALKAARLEGRNRVCVREPSVSEKIQVVTI